MAAVALYSKRSPTQAAGTECHGVHSAHMPVCTLGTMRGQSVHTDRLPACLAWAV